MAETRSKQATVTDEHREEARRLKSLWDAAKAKRDGGGPKFTQESFGAEFDIGNQGAVWQFLNGKAPLSAKAASGFARGLGCRVSDFSPRLAAIVESPSMSRQARELVDLCDNTLTSDDDRDYLVGAVRLAIALRKTEAKREADDAGAPDGDEKVRQAAHYSTDPRDLPLR